VRARELSAAAAVETYEIRALLAGRAARCTAQRASKDDVIGFRTLLDASAELPTEDFAAHQPAVMVRAIEAGDPEAAEAATRTHVHTEQGLTKERMEQPNGASR